MTWTIPEKSNESIQKKLARNIHSQIDSLSKSNISVSYGNSILNLSCLDSLRLIYDRNPKSKSERLFKQFLIKTYSDSERACPGSGFIALISFLKATLDYGDIENSILNLKNYSKYSKRAKEKDLLEILRLLSPNDNILEFCKNILYQGGFNSSCNIETTYELQDYVSVNNFHIFDVRLDHDFSSITKIENLKCQNVDLILADGIIESVSEIHHALEHYNKNKKTCFIICRGYEPEVITTLSKNFLRGTLKVIPLVLVHNLDSINSLKDISVISGSNLISTLKGEKISSIDVNDVPSVEYLNCSLKNLEIRNKKNSLEVMTLVKNLKNNLDSERSQDVKDILQKRITSLSPRKLNVMLSNHFKDSVGLKKDRIKSMISIINSTCTFGIVSLEEKIKDKLLIEIFKFFKDQNFKSMPSKCFFEGIKSGLINAKIFKNSANFILLED